MGSIVNGKWTNGDVALFQDGGFERKPSPLDAEISSSLLQAIWSEPGRYHLIASHSCPWSHRALIAHRVKGLDDVIPVKIAAGKRIEGYSINNNEPWRLPGTTRDVKHVHEIYTTADPAYSGRATVPLLWDSVDQKIISNDSLEIMKAFDRINLHLPKPEFTLYPKGLKQEIDALIHQIFIGLSNGVYRAGLAQNQTQYNDATADVFETLDLLEARLSRGRFLFGGRLTLTDVVLFPVLVRFDIVYHTHFRCTRRRLTDYPALWAYSRDLFSWKAFNQDVDFDAIREGYFLNDGDHNPHKIISDTPECDWFAPHHRAAFGPAMISSGEEEDKDVSNANLLTFDKNWKVS